VRPTSVSQPPRQEPPTRLARRLGLADATILGLGSMTGAGVFALAVSLPIESVATGLGVLTIAALLLAARRPMRRPR